MKLHTLKQKPLLLGLIIISLIFAASAAIYLILKENHVVGYEDFYIEKVDRPDISFAFDYKSGDDGLALVEPPLDEGPLKAAFILIPVPDFIEVRNNPGGEAPPSISIFVFDLPTRQNKDDETSKTDYLKQWAIDNEALTSISELEGEPESVKVDGAKGLKYSIEGTYKQDIVLVSYLSKVYMFVGQYEDGGDKIRKDFEDVLSRVAFN